MGIELSFYNRGLEIQVGNFGFPDGPTFSLRNRFFSFRAENSSRVKRNSAMCATLILRFPSTTGIDSIGVWKHNLPIHGAAAPGIRKSSVITKKRAGIFPRAGKSGLRGAGPFHSYLGLGERILSSARRLRPRRPAETDKIRGGRPPAPNVRINFLITFSTEHRPGWRYIRGWSTPPLQLRFLTASSESGRVT